MSRDDAVGIHAHQRGDVSEVGTVIDHVDHHIGMTGRHRVRRGGELNLGEPDPRRSLIGRIGQSHQHGAGTGNDVGDSGDVGRSKDRGTAENLIGGTAFEQQCPIAVVADRRRAHHTRAV